MFYEFKLPTVLFKRDPFGKISKLYEKTSVPRKTTLAQRLPDDYEEKISRVFITSVINQHREQIYLLDRIAYMDETPLTFDMPEFTRFRYLKILNNELSLASSVSKLTLS